MKVEDIKAFIPSKDFAASIAFYEEIGFHSQYVSNELILFENGDCYFFLQNFYDEMLASNFMLQICVSDIDAAYAQCEASSYKTKISGIKKESWGKVFYLWGPAGELLHMTELSD